MHIWHNKQNKSRKLKFLYYLAFLQNLKYNILNQFIWGIRKLWFYFISFWPQSHSFKHLYAFIIWSIVTFIRIKLFFYLITIIGCQITNFMCFAAKWVQSWCIFLLTSSSFFYLVSLLILNNQYTAYFHPNWLSELEVEFWYSSRTRLRFTFLRHWSKFTTIINQP